MPDIDLPPTESMLPHYADDAAWLHQRHAEGLLLAAAARLFRRKVNLTPAQYRRRFVQMRRMLSGEPAVMARPH